LDSSDLALRRRISQSIRIRRHSGWQDWSWAADNLACASTVHSGTDSISVTPAAHQALYLYHNDFSTSGCSNLTFWINSGPWQTIASQTYAGLTNFTLSYTDPLAASATQRFYRVGLVNP
jgi:hypothetical protein